jgi:Carboxypeptidase regulatory-like domain/TonB-dependent Receptor Plug Domain/TonB dependent receptor
MSKLKSISILLLAAALLLTCSLSFAQTITTGDVTGTLMDASGAVIPDAVVVLKSLETGASRTVKSNNVGIYRFNLISPGRYEISATSSGLRSDIGGIVVGVGQVTAANLTLKVEESKQVVLVTEAAPVLQADNANLATSFSAAQVESLPAPGGDITSLAFTVPGIVVSTGSGYGNFNSHGLPGISNLFTMNGVDEMDPYLNLNNSGASNLTLGQNEVQEVSVVQNGYSAQYGRQAGAQVNFITKSGSNAFHGSMLYTYNGSFMNANDFFNNETDTPRGRAISNQYGALLSGPILKNKLFFLVDTEGLRYVLPSSGVVSLPSAALQTYILGHVAASQVPFYQQAFGLYNAAPGASRAVPVGNGDGPQQDSGGALGCGGLAGTPTGVGNGVFGTNVSCANAFGTNLTNQNSEWLFTTRVDYNINDSNKLFARFKTDHGIQPTDTNAVNPIFNVISNQPSYEGSLNLTTVFSPRIVNTFLGSSTYYSAIFSPANIPASLAAFPLNLNILDGGANGTGGFTSLGFSNSAFPQGRRVGQLQILDDLSYNVGKHSLKFGTNYRYNRVTDTGNQELTFGGQYNLVDLSEFAAGAYTSASGSNFAERFSSIPVTHNRLYNIGIYAQDEWALKTNLKVTLGLRFDRNGNPSCTDDCFARLNAPFETISHGASIPYNQSIQTGLSNAFYSIETGVVQPRVAIAWSPGFSKGTVIRGGFGIFADQFPSYFIGALSSQAPYVFTPSVRQALINSSGPGSGPAIAANSAAAFKTGFANGATLAQLQAAVAPVTLALPGYTSVASEMKSSKYSEWNFEIQQQIGAKNVFSVGYVGNHGWDIFNRQLKLNGANELGNFPNGFDNFPTVRADPRFNAITAYDNSGYSNYDGMTVQFRRSLTAGLQGQINYTWSHSLDTLSNGGLSLFANAFTSLTNQISPYDKGLNYSSSDYDVRHQISADLTYAFPFHGAGWMKHAVAGWNFGTKIFYHTGAPFSVYNSRIPGRLSASTGGTILAQAINPGLTATCGPSAVDTPCLSTSQFASVSAQNNFGNQPRNSYRGPGYVDTDATLYKSFRLWSEASRITVGAQAYNIFNHPNFAAPSSNLAVGGFGSLYSTVDAPTSPYGSFQGSAVSGRVLALTGKITF